MTSAPRVPLVSTLRRLLHSTAPAPMDTCELCMAELPQSHGHIVDTVSRRLLCACGACGGTFHGGLEARHSASGVGRYRVVPRRYVHHGSMTLSEAEWRSLAIPVGLAFFFFNSDRGRMAAFYPGPAGPTESQLPLEAWPPIAEAHSWIGGMAPDVEALLVREVDGRRLCFIVPIDACYELVGRIRAHWSGMGGGDRVRIEIDVFFAELVTRSRGQEGRP